MTTKKPYVLSIAGFDPSAGAGVLADIKTMEQCGVYGLGVCSALTYQNEDEFEAVKWVSFEEMKKQLEPLFRKYNISFVKIGLIESLETLDKIISLLTNNYSNIKIIWDPILSASAGFNFHSNLDQERLISVIKRIYLVTPNQLEFDTLNLNIESYCNLLVKGGHNKVHDDMFFFKDFEKNRNEHVIIKGSTEKLYPKHGSGCVLSSAIASYLTLGFDLPASCTKAKKYVEALLGSNNGLLGYHAG